MFAGCRSEPPSAGETGSYIPDQRGGGGSYGLCLIKHSWCMLLVVTAYQEALQIIFHQEF